MKGYIYRPSIYGQMLYSLIDNIEICGYCDNRVKEGFFRGLEIVNVEKVIDSEEYYIIIGSKFEEYGKDIYFNKILKAKNILVYNSGSIISLDQYKKQTRKFYRITCLIKQYSSRMTFSKLMKRNYRVLYAGNIPLEDDNYDKKIMVGLKLGHSDRYHIGHDITKKYPIPDNSIDAYQAEDVFEHINYNELVDTINEIYRILKPGGYFRLTLPDYGCPCLKYVSITDSNGKILFDPYGGGEWDGKNVKNGGHVWFPTYKSVLALLEKSKFSKFDFLNYYDENRQIEKEIDYSKGYIQRTSDHFFFREFGNASISLVVDCYK